VREPVSLIDPELVAPAEEHRSSLAFWARLLDWELRSEFRLGEQTYRAYAAIAEHPPTIPDLPSGDFWRLFGTLASRLAKPSAGDGAGEALLGYSAHWGSEDNPKALEADLRAHGGDGPVFVGTVSECWSDESVLTNVSLIVDFENDRASALRAEWLAGSRSFDLMKARSADFFPFISFHEGAWSGFGDISGDKSANTQAVFAHLSVLNDLACSVWVECTQASDKEAHFASRGVAASPESPKVHKDGDAMAARWFSFSGKRRLCEWHTKIHPTSGRIYFDVDPDLGRVFVGFIGDHL
jgi:hypothetical protein